MPEIEVGDIKVKMTVDEFIEFLKRSDPSEMSQKLKALATAKSSTTTPPTQ